MRRVIFLLVIGGLGLAALLGLGGWQLQRKAWKEGILATIEARIAAEPAAGLPAALDPEADKYTPVRLTGQIGEEELHVLISFKEDGAGYRVISPFTLEDGRRILLDRGFIPAAAKDAARRAGPATVEANLHWPDETDSYTPAPDVDGNIWYARDAARMAAELGTEPVMAVLRSAPQWQDAAVPAGQGAPRPVPVSTAAIPNDHLQYAITWFSLAFIWAAMTLYFLRRSRTQS
ncbi:SURF1 family protein [Cribrihabitans neustonicus]|uniref:SURF1 family protein n=1 Tax=Cribrihabitans neustonicus TaxID=1429085 RepID=UPI003B5C8BD0